MKYYPREIQPEDLLRMTRGQREYARGMDPEYLPNSKSGLHRCLFCQRLGLTGLCTPCKTRVLQKPISTFGIEQLKRIGRIPEDYDQDPDAAAFLRYVDQGCASAQEGGWHAYIAGRISEGCEGNQEFEDEQLHKGYDLPVRAVRVEPRGAIRELAQV